MKKILVCLAVVFAVVSASDFELNELCGEILFATLAHPTDKNLFIGCIKGKGTILGCDENEVFDQYTVQCLTDVSTDVSTEETTITSTEESTNEPTDEEPTESPTDEPTIPTTTAPTTRDPNDITISFVCPLDGFGIIPNVSNCSRYFECIQGIRFPRYCEDNKIFDVITHECGDPETSLCAANIRCI